MDNTNLALLIPILVPTGLFAMIFGVVYLRNRERMAMIERGMDPRRYKPQSAPYQTLKWGLLLIGCGVGLFLAFLLDHTVFRNFGGRADFDYDEPHNVAVYFALITIFGGLGLFQSFRMEKKENDNGKVD